MPEWPGNDLFGRFGVELEYMIVDRERLDVRAWTDALFRRLTGRETVEDNSVALGALELSNELAAHVVEIKTGAPVPSLDGLAEVFQTGVGRVNDELDALGAQLLPTGAHPWMDPLAELVLWPHGDQDIYRAFDRIFDCRGHGWANLQSMHLNLPFADDVQFGKLHAAIRAVLPLLPALAASTPILDGRVQPWLDTRLETYRLNARRIPQVSGTVVPEPLYTPAAYEAELLQPLFRAIAPHDPEHLLQYEWLNARGAIARFERGTIEIRVLDLQEYPGADLAVAQAIVAILQALCDERWGPLDAVMALDGDSLVGLLGETVRVADAARVNDPALLRALGQPDTPVPAGALWAAVLDDLGHASPEGGPLATILSEGPLARRILAATGATPDRARLRDVYGELSDCLRLGRSFRAA